MLEKGIKDCQLTVGEVQTNTITALVVMSDAQRLKIYNDIIGSGQELTRDQQAGYDEALSNAFWTEIMSK